VIVYRCKRCGYTLHVFPRVGSPRLLPTPSEVIAMVGGFCPRCGRRLQKPTIDDVVIRPLSESERALQEKCAVWPEKCVEMLSGVAGDAVLQAV